MAKRILVVDDDENISAWNGTILEQEEINVTSTGAEPNTQAPQKSTPSTSCCSTS